MEVSTEWCKEEKKKEGRKKEFTDQQSPRIHLITLLLFSVKDINVTCVFIKA